MGATPCLLHPSCFRKKAGSSGRFPQGAQSAKKGPGATGITTPNPVTDINRNWGNLKTRAGYGFQLSTGLFPTLPAGRAGAGLWLAGRQKPIKTLKNRTEIPAPGKGPGWSYRIGASRNVPYVQRGEQGYSGITTPAMAGHWKNPGHPSDFLTGLISALPRNGKGRSWPRTRTPHPTISSNQSPLQGAGGQGPVGWVKWKERRPNE